MKSVFFLFDLGHWLTVHVAQARTCIEPTPTPALPYPDPCAYLHSHKKTLRRQSLHYHHKFIASLVHPDTRRRHVLVLRGGFDRPSHLAASVSGVKPSQFRISSASGPSRRVISQSTTSCAARSSAPSPVPPSSSRPPPPPPASRSRQNSKL